MKSASQRATTAARSPIPAALTIQLLVLVALSLLALFAFVPTAGAASGDLAWQRVYNGTGNADDVYVAAAPAPNSGVYVAGSARMSHRIGIVDYVDYDLLVARYAANGQRLWLRTLGGPGKFPDDFVADATSDSNGNVVVVGWVNPTAVTQRVAVIVKYGPQGQQRWVRFYDDPAASLESATRVAIDAVGNVYVAGRSVSAASGDDLFLIKYSPTGKRTWVRRYAGPDGDEVNDIAIDDYGNVYATGISFTTTTRYDILTLKYAPNGKRRWVRRFDGPASDNDAGRAVAVTSTGTVYVAGEVTGITSAPDATVVKYSSGGAFRWVRTRTSSGANDDGYQDVTVMGNGDVVVAGKVNSTSPGISNVFLVRLSPAGGTRWARSYDGPDALNDEGHHVARGPNGDIYVSGSTRALASLEDILTLKYGAQGQLRWARSHMSAGDGRDFDGALVARRGAVYTAGGQWALTGNDATLLKYRP